MLIIGTKNNQLGNRLFLFAHLIAFAIEQKTFLINPFFEEYADFFMATESDLFCSYPPSLFRLKNNKRVRRRLSKVIVKLVKSLENKRVKFIPVRILTSSYESTKGAGAEFLLDNKTVFQSVNTRQINLLKGPLFRCPSLLRKHNETIRAYFRISEVFQKNVDRLIAKSKENCNLLIGVHIRQGDYKNFLNGKYFYSIEDYITVMERIRSLFPDKNVSFLICSDVRFEEKTFPSINKYLFGTGHIVEDMYSLAQCDYIIGPPSTYSGWASFYGKVPRYEVEDVTKMPEIKDFRIVLG
jgi:Glycosyl transferase family 11